MSQATLAIRRISGHAGPAPGEGVERDYQVCKLVDTTTCIGCKACEVACLEWNGYEFTDTVFDNSYQTMPETTWKYWNLIKFNEHEREDGTVTLLMRKDQCMHCADPGCLAACPADGAIVQYTNGIVDFQQQNCIGCGYCVSGCPFDIPKFNPTTKKMFKCTLCVDRVSEGLEPACIKSCPTGCLHFGTKDDMTDLAEKRKPLMMMQHPLFRGINDDAGIITEMYDRMDAGNVVVKPYYLIHPFPDGTLPEHRLTLKESQRILRGLASAPGTRVPLLTVPTPMGKCVIGPWEELVDRGGYYLLHTKDGVAVEYTTGELYNPAERRSNIPIAMTIKGK